MSIPDSAGNLVIYNRAENEIIVRELELGYIASAFASPLPAGTDTNSNAGDAASLTSANTYSNAGDAATLTSANTYSNGVGAMMMAASQVSLTADPTANLSIGLGIGSMAGEDAFAIGLMGNHQETSTRYSFTAAYNDFTGTTAYGAGVRAGHLDDLINTNKASIVTTPDMSLL